MARGAEVVVAALHDAGAAPPEPSAADLVVTLGSAHAADDDGVPWQAVERAALAAALAAGTPVLGLCFGGQALARALGGGVRRAAAPELGWVRAGTVAPSVVPDGPWFTWHLDEILPPPGAEVLARNPSGVQAFRLGPHAGVQFHPEVTPGIVGGWLRGDPATARRLGGDPDALLAATERDAPAARARAFALFDALVRY